MNAPRPFRVLGLQQIAIGGADRRALRALWVDCFGLTSLGEHRSEQENVDEERLALGHGLATVEVDLMQPIDPSRKPRVDQPALNHIGLWVDDLRAAVSWLEARGVRFAPGGIRVGAAGHEICFIHPQPTSEAPLSGMGTLIELVQAPTELLTGSVDA